MPGLGLVPMMLQMNLNKLLFLMIDSNPKIKDLGVSKYVRKWYYKYCFAYFGKDFLTGK